jgi:hypothetical protein
MYFKFCVPPFWIKRLTQEFVPFWLKCFHMSSGSAKYSWESRAHSFDDRQTDVDPEGFWDASDSDEDLNTLSPGDASEYLLNFLFSLHYAGKLSAKSLCVISWYASLAGGAAPLDKFGFRPDAPSGHYQRHLDTVNGIKMKDQQEWRYTISIPGHAKHDNSRKSHDIMVNVPHEVLHKEILEDSTILDNIASTPWPPLYHSNPIVRTSETPVLPLALYLDGVPSTRRDGILGFWLYNLISMKRHLICVLRKSHLCRCGCKSWCSLHPIWTFLLWSLRSIALGVFPSSRHDLVEWKDSDSARISRVGQELSFKGVLLQIKGDWAEFCSSMGFDQWSHARCPCPFCIAFKDQLGNFAGFSPVSSSYTLVKPSDYDEACNRAEHKVVLSREQHGVVKNSLVYNNDRNGPRGRALICDVPSLNLFKGDRLEPDRKVQDIGQVFDDVAVFPLPVTFWRQSPDHRVTHRCPIFDDALGITIDTVCVDTLH